MRSSNFRTKIIEALSETPLVFYACKKVGISRATFYRWRKDNLEFRNQVDEILKTGREYVSELCEASLIKEIKNGNLGAIKFWLQHNNQRYLPMRTIYVDPHAPQELRPGQTCKLCGSMSSSTVMLTKEEDERIEKMFAFRKKPITEENVKIIEQKANSQISEETITLTKSAVKSMKANKPKVKKSAYEK